MPQKTVELPDIGQLTLYKRRGAKHIRLSIASNGIRVTMPIWAPYKMGVEFALQRVDWIKEHHKPEPVLKSFTTIGKSHRLVFVRDNTKDKVTSRLAGHDVRIMVPAGLTLESPEVQKVAHSAAYRALKREAEALFPRRVRELAESYGFDFKSIQVKRLKGRWGSCTSHGDITLNSFLMQLPWELIDYVILHELVHTRIMAHGPVFWDEVAKYVDNLPAKRKRIKTYHPVLGQDTELNKPASFNPLMA